MSNANVHALDPSELTIIDVAQGVDRAALLRVITGRCGGIAHHDDTGLPASMSFYHWSGKNDDGEYGFCTTVLESERRPAWAMQAPGCWSSPLARARQVKKPRSFTYEGKKREIHMHRLGTVKFRDELYSVHLSRVPGSPGTPAGFPL